ncbi:MAG: hypothetical protein A2169_13850 [Deltaproteobacteria bacterium RBG_13_47_9]|nr:MAG: hypothetical protein A2169_13850 [Deltaproteobacteria bacterium RBG_13_47_9]
MHAEEETGNTSRIHGSFNEVKGAIPFDGERGGKHGSTEFMDPIVEADSFARQRGEGDCRAKADKKQVERDEKHETGHAPAHGPPRFVI